MIIKILNFDLISLNYLISDLSELNNKKLAVVCLSKTLFTNSNQIIFTSQNEVILFSAEGDKDRYNLDNNLVDCVIGEAAFRAVYPNSYYIDYGLNHSFVVPNNGDIGSMSIHEVNKTLNDAQEIFINFKVADKVEKITYELQNKVLSEGQRALSADVQAQILSVKDSLINAQSAMVTVLENPEKKSTSKILKSDYLIHDILDFYKDDRDGDSGNNGCGASVSPLGINEFDFYDSTAVVAA